MTSSRKVDALGESSTLLLTARARRMKEAGLPVISFTAGEPDFPTPRHIKDAAIRAIEENFTRYTPAEGIQPLREAIARKLGRENGLDVSPGDILVSAGAKHGVANALAALCNPGDEVVILSPYWVSYPSLVQLADATPVIVPLERRNGYRPDPERISRAITPRTKALILNSPCNPTGTNFMREELEEIGQATERAGVTIISDEVYEKFLYDGEAHCSPASLSSFSGRVVTVNSVSKTYAMPGWRIGYSTGPAAIMKAAARVQGHVLSCVNSVAQKAALAALDGPDTAVREMVSEFRSRRDAAEKGLSGIPGIDLHHPEGGMFFFLGVQEYSRAPIPGATGEGSAALANYLLDRWHVGVVPGSAFGEEGALRLSYCTPEAKLMEGVERIRKGLAQLRA